MPDLNEEIKLYEVGEYGSLMRRPNPKGFVILTVPDFDSLIPALETKRNCKFNQQKIDGMREKAVTVVLTKDEAERMIASRNE